MLALASHTGWAEAEMLRMRVSRFVNYLERLARMNKQHGQ